MIFKDFQGYDIAAVGSIAILLTLISVEIQETKYLLDDYATYPDAHHTHHQHAWQTGEITNIQQV